MQGVWFRKSTQEAAAQFEINGWVKNLDDGSVATEIEGSLDSCAEMMKWLEKGSPLSEVESLEIEQIAPLNDTYFTIAY